jgi:hypothetical protein
MPRGKGKGKGTKAIPISYDPVGDDVLDLARDLIRNYHPMLVNAQISYLYRNKAMTKGESVVYATAQKLSPKLKALCGSDFLITIAFETWRELSDLEKRMVLDHELCHLLIEESDTTGETKFKILEHTFEDFSIIISRYGFTGYLEKFGVVCKEVISAEIKQKDPV